MWVESEIAEHYNVVAIFPDSRQIRTAISRWMGQSTEPRHSSAIVITTQPVPMHNSDFWRGQERHAVTGTGTRVALSSDISLALSSEIVNSVGPEKIETVLSQELGHFNAQRIERQLDHGGSILWLKVENAEQAREIQTQMFQQGAYDVQVHTHGEERAESLNLWSDVDRWSKAKLPMPDLSKKPPITDQVTAPWPQTRSHNSIQI